jgi:hypothetical protein
LRKLDCCSLLGAAYLSVNALPELAPKGVGTCHAKSAMLEPIGNAGNHATSGGNYGMAEARAKHECVRRAASIAKDGGRKLQRRNDAFDELLLRENADSMRLVRHAFAPASLSRLCRSDLLPFVRYDTGPPTPSQRADASRRRLPQLFSLSRPRASPYCCTSNVAGKCETFDIAIVGSVKSTVVGE